jgi:hypothetical protein
VKGNSALTWLFCTFMLLSFCSQGQAWVSKKHPDQKIEVGMDVGFRVVK